MSRKRRGPRRKGRKVRIERNIFDRIVETVDPVRAARRYRARAAMAITSVLTGGYIGASRSRRGLKKWNPFGNDADSDILPDLDTLRERSRDLIRNNPLAAGAINTKVTSVVGTGLKLQAHIDNEFLKITEDKSRLLEAQIEREWRLFWNSRECDAARTLNGNGITRLVYRQARENGDVFIVLPRIKLPGMPYDLRLQVVEADRVCNKDNKADTETLAGGIERDRYGAPKSYHILKYHPCLVRYFKQQEWTIIPAFGRLGLRNVIHVYDSIRPNQSRGVPDLAPVIEPLKQLGRYTEGELMATVISSFFTVFIESEAEPNFDLTDLSGETGSRTTDDDYKLASGAIIGLNPGEKVHDTNPGRPNDSFDAFVQAVLRQIGVALQLPFEILIKHFTASYSASRAAMLEAWKYFMSERQWLADNFIRPVYEIWMYEAVAKGRIGAPGFFRDPLIRQAYLGSEWVGPARGQIDEEKEIKAAEKRIELGVSTRAEVTAEMTGGDWEKKHAQRVKEEKMRKEAGLTQNAESKPREQTEEAATQTADKEGPDRNETEEEAEDENN